MSKKPWKCLARTPVDTASYFDFSNLLQRQVWQILRRESLFFRNAHFVRIGFQKHTETSEYCISALPYFCEIGLQFLNSWKMRFGRKISARCQAVGCFFTRFSSKFSCIIFFAAKHIHRFHCLILHWNLRKRRGWTIHCFQAFLTRMSNADISKIISDTWLSAERIQYSTYFVQLQ